jgi:hypothetical protein
VRKLACAFGCVSIASEKAKAAASCRTPRRPSGAASQKVCGIASSAGNSKPKVEFLTELAFVLHDIGHFL